LVPPHPSLFPYTTLFRSVMETACHNDDDEELAFGLILLDIDHFGLFNNHYGHLEGDIALMRIGHILEHHTQNEEEVFCRIGGERSEEHTSELQSRENLVC